MFILGEISKLLGDLDFIVIAVELHKEKIDEEYDGVTSIGSSMATSLPDEITCEVLQKTIERVQEQDRRNFEILHIKNPDLDTHPN